jgi:hypothetical protein
MSHDGIWRAACRIRLSIRLFHFGTHEIARGVTDVGVGSGALLGSAPKTKSDDASTLSSPEQAAAIKRTEPNAAKRPGVMRGTAWETCLGARRPQSLKLPGFR